MPEKIGLLTERETIIESLRSRLKVLRAEGYPTNPEINLLQKALRLEKKILETKSQNVRDFFTTGYAGRRAIQWNFVDGNWSGQLVNRESGNIKKTGTGKSAEEILRGLMPTR